MTAFVAYPSQDRELAATILASVRHANAKSTSVRYEPWEYNDVAGQPLSSPILERIQESSFVIADVTYLNLNVVYEIGFAIGQRRRAFLVRHSNVTGDRQIATQAGIFDTLGYFEYSDPESLTHRLVNHIEPTPLPFGGVLDGKAPVYLIESPEKREVATVITSRLKKARYRYRSFTPSEDSRLSATDAIRQVAASAGVLVPLLDSKEQWVQVHNVRAMFVAGLADGMGKPLLLLAPSGYLAPLDVRDDVKEFKHPDQIADAIAAFVPEIAEYLQQVDPVPQEYKTSLQALEMGDPTAENEMTTLGQYYLQTEQYSRTLQGSVNLVVGRKGSGKTALFIQARDKIRSDKRNVVVDLKPEGYQLIKLKEDILGHLSEGSRQHLVTAFWEYLLLLEIAYKLLEKDRHTHRFNHEIRELYLSLEATYLRETLAAEGDFSERLLSLSEKVASAFQQLHVASDNTRLSADDVARLLYTNDIKTLQTQLSNYLEKKQSVWILFDNLDKGWSTKGVDEVDVVVLRCLIDAGRKLERDMRKAGHRLHCVVFVRNDVYDFLMQTSADYGKEMRAVVDWTDPDQLRQMLKLRLAAGLGVGGDVSFEKLWSQVCVSHIHGDETAAFIIDRSLMRPRNVLKLFNHSRGFANNLNRLKIAEEDIEKGFRAYSQDLLTELDRELSDVFPDAKDLLYYFLDAPKELSIEKLKQLLAQANVEGNDHQLVIEFLLYYGVLGLRTQSEDQYIFNVHYDPKVLLIRAELLGEDARYVINPAFCPALGIH